MRKLHLFTAFIGLGLGACAQPGGHPPATSPDVVDGTKSNRPKITSAQLLGQHDAWLLDKMGAPHFKRADSVANLWQYKNGHCVLNVFLYADEPVAANTAPGAGSGPARVLHFDARDAEGKAADRDACLAALQN